MIETQEVAQFAIDRWEAKEKLLDALLEADVDNWEGYADAVTGIDAETLYKAYR